jgi:short subunit dehydrogenase-like uncharacterized protein
LNFRVLIVGGYGEVGSRIAHHLARQSRFSVTIAGRNETRARQFAQELGASSDWLMVDVTGNVNYDTLLAEVQFVVMCLDLPNVGFARECLQRGIHYVDVSAEYSTLSAIADLNEFAKKHNALGMLSVGLIPGLSNLMASSCGRLINPIHQLDIAILLGTGEKHGAAAVAWVLQHLSDDNGTSRIRFPEPYAQRTVHRFPFSDQYTLKDSLSVANAASWLCFDSPAMTRLIGLARLPLMRQLFKQRWIKQIAAHIIQKWHVGREDFVLTARAKNDLHTHQVWLTGKHQSEATGLVAALVVEQLTSIPALSGVYHIEQLFQLEDFLPALEKHGYLLSETTPSVSKLS